MAARVRDSDHPLNIKRRGFGGRWSSIDPRRLRPLVRTTDPRAPCGVPWWRSVSEGPVNRSSPESTTCPNPCASNPHKRNTLRQAEEYRTRAEKTAGNCRRLVQRTGL